MGLVVYNLILENKDRDFRLKYLVYYIQRKMPQGHKKGQYVMKHIKEGNNRDSKTTGRKNNFLVIGQFNFQHIQLLR